jgi:lipoyl-dependent peroxiredoxin subunit D
MSLKAFAEALPDYAEELKRNVEALLADQTLDEPRRSGLILACAHGTGHGPLVAAVEADIARAESDGRVPPGLAQAARAAAARMAMTNVYYRFVHLVSAPDYAHLPSRLRLDRRTDPDVSRADVELFGLAVSAMNGCGLCIDAHETALRRHGVTPGIVQTGARFAAILKAVATVHAAQPEAR